MKNKIPALLFLGLASSLLIYSSCKKEESAKKEQPTNTGGGEAPALLVNPVTGAPLTPQGNIDDFTFAYNEGRVVLLAVSNISGKVYAIELDDHDATAAATNAWNGPSTNFMTNIAGQMGTSLSNMRVMNMEVNPISKSVYVLVFNTQNNRTALFKATKGGTEIAPVDLSNVTYSAITFSTSGQVVNDLTWGDNTLYLSDNLPATLNGELATLTAPFAHNAVMQSRPTSLFKSNWGGMYYTDAPMETMTYAQVDGQKKLMGVTVCSPGYSFNTSDIAQGTGVLQVDERFNLNTNTAVKVFAMQVGDNSYLVELHNTGRLTRVGEKYLNGSQPMNENVKYILTNGGTTRAVGLTDEDVKIVQPAGTYVMISKFSDTQLLVMGTNGGVSILDI